MTTDSNLATQNESDGGIGSTSSTAPAIFVRDEEVRHTLIAALRFWQEKGMCDPVNRSDEMHDLATNGDEVTSLCDVDVDRLVEDLVWPPTAEDFSVLLNPKT
ncbi:hypothetical protein [Pseudomonas sp. PDM25]|uniref:hypothetical protein n=1 Tax=Pseudomonas sp. PDM25 TaxID=2854772 RepID=UPI001C483984|nr:hypothetical protein [Pseudomonas sp. PDM25]MBV7514478.1 hypothetical protein [Pseudomonas sp. PDM25]